jgi:lysophospholipase L1-like esterase
MIKTTSVLLALTIPTLTWAVPANPSNLQFSKKTGRSITLTWRDNSQDERNFKIFRNEKFIKLLPANTTSYTDTGLNPNTFYRYEVRATDDQDNFLDHINATMENGDIVFSSKGRLLEGSHTSFLIDADNNPNTGRTYGNIIGADYLIQNNALFTPRPNTSRQWDIVNHAVTHTHTTSGDTFRISLNDAEQIQLSDKIKYTATVATDDWTKEMSYAHMKELYIQKPTHYPMIVIGPSTVHFVNEYDRSVREDGSPCTLEGWGEVMPEFVKSTSMFFNYARAGASAESFRFPPSPNATTYNLLYGPNQDHYWAKTKEKMEALGEGILFIQFGGNDAGHLANKYPTHIDNIQEKPLIDYDGDGDGDMDDVNIAWNLRYAEFRYNLKFFIDEARKLHFSPIMITSPNARIPDANGRVKDSRGYYPTVMKQLGEAENVRVLDLHALTLETYQTLSQAELDAQFANCYTKDGRKEYTHTEIQGARKIANWVIDLLCVDEDDMMAGDVEPCTQFKGF